MSLTIKGQFKQQGQVKANDPTPPAPAAYELWRLLVVSEPTQSSSLIDLEPDAQHGWYAPGDVSITAPLTGLTGGQVGIQQGQYGPFGPNANPFTSNTKSVSTGSTSYFEPSGARGYWPTQPNEYTAFRFSTPLALNTVSGGYIRLKTFAGDRPDRIPQDWRLQYYTGDLVTYDSNAWTTYSTLTAFTQEFGIIQWTNITESSTIAGIQG